MTKTLSPYPSSPSSPPRFSIKCEWPKEENKRLTQGFRYIWGAYFFVQHMIDNKEIKWQSPTHLITSTGLHISSDDLEGIVNHDPTETERNWVPPTNYRDMYDAFLKKKRVVISGPPIDSHENLDLPRELDRKATPRAAWTPKREDAPAPTPPTADRTKRRTRTETTKTPADPKVETKVEAKDTPPTKRASSPARKERPAGLQSIGEIAASINLDPREARSILRSTKTPKPAEGWAWPTAEIESIVKLLNKHRKAAS